MPIPKRRNVWTYVVLGIVAALFIAFAIWAYLSRIPGM